MTRRLLIGLVALLVPVEALAQARTYKYEALTVSSSAVSVTASTLSGMGTCRAQLETAEVRWRMDGTAPTSTVGTPLSVGSIIEFDSIIELRAAQFIRTGGTDGTLHVWCYPAGGGQVRVAAQGSGIDGSTLTDIATNTENTANNTDSILDNLSQDATHDAAAQNTGPQFMGECDDTSTDAVDEGDAGKARIDCTTRALLNALVARTSGGCTPNSSISTAAVMETEIKATAGQLYALVITNLDETAVFARLYNDTAANTDENDTPIQRFAIPTATGAIPGGVAVPIPSTGMEFTTAITLRITTGAADNNTGALSANEVFVSYCYK